MSDSSASSTSFAPVASTERLYALDTLRGVALLGILLMNILTFAFPMATYFNPNVAGGNSGPNWAIWFVQYVFWDGKMRAIFSLMFGVGLLLLTERASKRGADAGIADVYLRRILWLLLFGIIHAFLVWEGDILYPYALIGLALYPFRKLSPKALLIIAGIQIALLTGASIAGGFEAKEKKQKYEEAAALKKQGKTLTDDQKAALESWESQLRYIAPTPEQLKKEIDAHKAGYVELFKWRVKEVSQWHGMPYYSPAMWDMMAMMFIGMALYKTGVLATQRSWRFYGWMAAIGFLLGVPLNAVSTWLTWKVAFDPVQTNWTMASYQLGRVAMALAYVAVLQLILKAGALAWLTARLAAVGQMAFSNYISHSLICSTLFYGYGFGLYQRMERYQVYGVVAAIWTFQLLMSPVWLRHFHFGPLEWCWRSLTYWKRQPFRIRPEVAVTEPAAPQEVLVVDALTPAREAAPEGEQPNREPRAAEAAAAD
ncbi:MAG: DUF418 domain-containing protein [Bryobacteraceae bacterium]|nr:DUF418 domain-containing protein [Bryobacteraceae bacterium]